MHRDDDRIERCLTALPLYGSRASHGVILITTKKAEKDRISVEYNGSYTIDTQLAKWDDIQEIYGAGYNGELPTSSTSGTNSSWGPNAMTSCSNISMAKNVHS